MTADRLQPDFSALSDNGVLALTDDEIAAISALTGNKWSLPLRTVNTANPDELRQSINRGVRSLEMRGFATADDLLVSELVWFSGTCGGPPWVIMSSISANGVVDSDSPWLTGWILESTLVSCTVLPTGVYLIEPVEADDYIGALVAEMLSAEVDCAIIVDGSGGLMRVGEAILDVDEEGTSDGVNMVGSSRDQTMIELGERIRIRKP